jgi:hypothetical protein
VVGRRQRHGLSLGRRGNNSLTDPGGVGGAATAIVNVGSTGGGVTLTATATGGNGGEQSGAGGAASATADASAAGFDVTATASSTGGEGATGALAGAGMATASATGGGGEIRTNALSQVSGSTALETEVGATGLASVNGSANGYAQTGFDGVLPTFQGSGATVEYGMAAPASAAVSAVLGANPTIAGVFGSSPDVYALGEIGGAHATSGTDAENSTSNVTVDVNTDNLSANEELAIGFYDGALNAAQDITSVVLDITDNGHTLVDQTFATGAVAQTYFTDNAFSALQLLSPGGGAADLTFSLTVNANGPSSGFYGDFIVGGVPEATPAFHRLG